MKIKLFRANSYRYDHAEINPASIKTSEGWNAVDLIVVEDDAAYEWLKAEGERLDMYTPCDYYTREEILKRKIFIHSDALNDCDFEWWDQRWWIDAEEAAEHTNDDRWFNSDIRKCL